MKKAILILAAAALVFAGCKKENPSESSATVSKLELEISVDSLSSSVTDAYKVYIAGTGFDGKHYVIPVTTTGKYSVSVNNPNVTTAYANSVSYGIYIEGDSDAEGFYKLNYEVYFNTYGENGEKNGTSLVSRAKQNMPRVKSLVAYDTKYEVVFSFENSKVLTGFRTVEEDSETYYAGEWYKTVSLSNDTYDQVWFAEDLRYVPEGQTVTSTPSDLSANIAYPYHYDNFAVRIDTTYNTTGDPASGIKTLAVKTSGTLTTDTTRVNGLLYRWDYIFGTPITAENYNTFEGKRGICPIGYHVPTEKEWKQLLGNTNGAADDTTAIAYDKNYKGARITNLISKGFGFYPLGYVFAGSYNMNNMNGLLSKYSTTNESWYSYPGMTYFASSTGYKTTQMYGAMSSFPVAMSAALKAGTMIGIYPEGRLNVGYANFAKGFVAVRCIRD